MLKHTALVVGFAVAVTGSPSSTLAQGRPNPTALLAAQTAAMSRFAFMDGVWRGTAWTLLPSGERHEVTQTERVGPFLGGAIRVIEGRGYERDGRLAFNAFAVISYNPQTSSYTMRSHAQGQAGDFDIAPTADGFTWEIPAGPMTIRYSTVVEDGWWREVGDRIQPGQDPVRFFEMELRRVGDSDWPAAGAIPAAAR